MYSTIHYINTIPMKFFKQLVKKVYFLYFKKKAESLLARYSQRWVKLIVRGGLALGIDAADRRRSHGGSLTPSQPQIPPRHMASRQCPCQYIEEHLQYKPQGSPITFFFKFLKYIFRTGIG